MPEFHPFTDSQGKSYASLQDYLAGEVGGFGGIIGNILLYAASSCGNTVWGAANDARYARALGAGIISKLRIHVAVQSGNICLAVYSPTGSGLSAAPGARKATTGAIACPGVGVQDISIGPVLIAPGDFIGMSCDNITASFFGNSAQGASGMFGGQLYAQATAHPLPDPATPVANNFRQPLIIGVP